MGERGFVGRLARDLAGRGLAEVRRGQPCPRAPPRAAILRSSPARCPQESVIEGGTAPVKPFARPWPVIAARFTCPLLSGLPSGAAKGLPAALSIRGSLCAESLAAPVVFPAIRGRHGIHAVAGARPQELLGRGFLLRQALNPGLGEGERMPKRNEGRATTRQGR